MNWAKLQEDLTGLPVAKRAKHSIHFDNGDGSITAHFAGKPCHYLDGAEWKPIDTKLVAKGNGYYGCPHSDVLIHPDGHVKAGVYTQYTELPSAQTGLVDGDKLVRKFAFGEQRMWVTEDGFRSEIVLNRIPTLTEARKLIASESGTLDLKYLRSLTTATDAKGSVHTYSTLTAFRTWLAAATFPVVIDPDFNAVTGASYYTLYGSNADYATSRSTCLWVGYADPTSTVGQLRSSGNYQIFRMFFKFDTSSIDDGTTISQVNLKLVFVLSDASGTDFDVQIVKCDWSGTDPLTTGNKETPYDAALSSAADDSIFRNTSGISLNTQYTSGNLNTSWVNKTGSTYYALRSSRDYAGTSNSGAEAVYIASPGYATESYRPVLTVTYTASGIAIPVAQYYYNRLRRIL